MSNSQETAPCFERRPTLARYRGMMVSITFFILIISALLALSFYSSNRTTHDTANMNISAQMRDMIQTMTRDLFNMKLSWGEDPSSPHMQTTLKRLNKNQQQFSHNLNTFLQGGNVELDGDSINIYAVTDSSDKKNILDVQQEWSIYGKLLQSYLKTATDVTIDATPLDLAVDQAQSSSLSIYEHLDKLTVRLQKKATDRARILQWVQLGGIVFAILYFIVFIFYFVRKLRTSDEEADNAKQETSEILATVKEGLFLLDKDLTIGGQYSQELESIIGQKEIGNKSLDTVLENLVPKDELAVTRGFINQLFNKKVKANLINDLNPLNRIKVEVNDFNGFYITRYLDFKFSRVYYGKEIERILVSVSDITNAVHLEERLAQEREQNDQQIEMLATILNTDPSLMDSFVNTVKSCINRTNSTLKSPGKSTPELQTKVHTIYREIHSMKGEASALKLHGFVTIADSFEEKLKQLQNSSNISGNDFLPLTMMLDELVNVFNTIEKLSSRISNFGGQSENKSHTPSTNNVLQQYFENFAKEMAERNKKQVKISCQGMDNDFLDKNTASIIKEVAIQLLRNAVSHGIESPRNRTAVGKHASGFIQLLLTQNSNDSAQLIVEDDGAGIDFEKIRSKAVEKGLYSAEEAKNLDKKNLLNLIFTSGFSTMDVGNEDAGRGVGMDVIRERIKGIKGNIKIASIAGKYTRFAITFPLN